MTAVLPQVGDMVRYHTWEVSHLCIARDGHENSFTLNINNAHVSFYPMNTFIITPGEKKKRGFGEFLERHSL